MINNSIVIALAIISVVCVYLIWENFKIRSKMKYLESSVHETIQTVQAMINTPFQHPPLQQQPHPHHHQVTPKQEQQQPQQQSHQQSQSEQPQENKMMGGGFLQNIISNIMKTVEQAAPMFDNCDLESVTDESTTEEDNKIEDIEPLDITEELKKEINDLTFAEDEDVEEDNFEPKIEELEDDENIEDLEEVEVNMEDVEDLEDVDVDNFEPKIEELEEVTTQVEEVTPQVEEVTPQVEKVTPQVEEIKEDEMMNDIEDIGDLEMSNEDADSYLTNPDVLGYLSLKQLQDIAEKNKLGKRGTKEQLITRIKRNMKLVK